ncbi:MAG TPA: hydrogenase iron-sulfur subunit, partial [Nitrospirae bacterium]|nr:hydrogenase iron-sulfur subunit [Nitrospirota bacterium]
LIRFMCSGRVEPEFVLEAFKKGADGVLMFVCHPGDCHYKEGNIRALGRYEIIIRMLDEFGIESERFVLEYVSASEGDRFVRLVVEMSAKLEKIGPLNL